MLLRTKLSDARTVKKSAHPRLSLSLHNAGLRTDSRVNQIVKRKTKSPPIETTKLVICAFPAMQPITESCKIPL